MKKIVTCLLLLLGSMLIIESSAQDIFKLWDGKIKPHYKKNNLQEHEKEAWGVICVYDVTEPTLTVYRAEGENSGKAVIIIPGGGYTLESIYHEGYSLARVLSQNGITAAVLKYRLPNPVSSDHPHMVPLADTRRALAMLREKSETYEFDRHKVGLVGFSAGSHLATVTSLWRSENEDENPDFSALIYGVTNLNEDNLKWIEESLYYRKLNQEELAQNRLLDLVSEDTPPAFLVHALNDDVCHVSESTLYASALSEHHVAYEMHLFPEGGHGFGMGRQGDGTDQWVGLFINWLKRTKV